MIGRTKKIRMLVAARPSYINPVLLAKMIATCDQLSGGRISINLIAGQSEVENIAEGVKLEKDQRYEAWTRRSRSSRRCGPRAASRSTSPASTTR